MLNIDGGTEKISEGVNYRVPGSGGSAKRRNEISFAVQATDRNLEKRTTVL